MRYGVLADIHGNLPALETVMKALTDAAVDGYLCAGDLVGYGPFPNECVERIAELRALCVAGNHDLIALGRLSSDDCIPIAQRSLAWTAEVLSPEARGYLEALPVSAIADGVVVAHGSLTDPTEYTRRPREAARQLDLLVEERPKAEVLVLGHTHRAWAFGEGLDEPALTDGNRVGLPARTPYLLNPGAVGQSREREPSPRARCIVLDLDRREALFLALEYDVEACRAALGRAGLSEEGVHLRPRAPVRRALWHAKRALDAATGR